MSYQQYPYRHRRLGSRNRESFYSDSPLGYQMTRPYSGIPTSACSPPSAPSAPSAPAMRYTSSTDSNRSAYTASSVSSVLSSPRLSHNYPLMSPSNASDAMHSGHISDHDTIGLDEDVSPVANPSKSTRKKTQERSVETEPPSSTGPTNQGRSSERYICLYPGCSSNFGRPADLTRHYVSVHQRDQHLIDCPVSRCSRKGSNGFPRQDHLNGHLRQYHGQNVERRTSSRSQRTGPSSPSY